MQERSVVLGRRRAGLRAISFEAVRRAERPERETLCSALSVGESVEKRRSWGTLERSAERVVERRIDAIAADGGAFDPNVASRSSPARPPAESRAG